MLSIYRRPEGRQWTRVAQLPTLGLSFDEKYSNVRKKIMGVPGHSVEKRKIIFHRKKIREITYVVISLAKTLRSRNFCQKSVRVISVISTLCGDSIYINSINTKPQTKTKSFHKIKSLS